MRARLVRVVQAIPSRRRDLLQFANIHAFTYPTGSKTITKHDGSGTRRSGSEAGVHRLAAGCTCADPCAAESRRLSAWHCNASTAQMSKVCLMIIHNRKYIILLLCICRAYCFHLKANFTTKLTHSSRSVLGRLLDLILLRH